MEDDSVDDNLPGDFEDISSFVLDLASEELFLQKKDLFSNSEKAKTVAYNEKSKYDSLATTYIDKLTNFREIYRV
jgi:hypothetical protein